MLSFFGTSQRFCDGVSRRDFLRVGGLAVGGLTLADVLRLRAQGADGNTARGKSVIMIYLPGGPSHLDMYDMKPEAPSEFRGEFRPVHTNVPGIDICELMPRQATIMDKMTIVRGVQFVDEHSPHMVMTGYSMRVHRPAFGSIVSYMQGRQNGLPPYVALNYNREGEDHAYTGSMNRPFVPSGPGLENLSLVGGVSLDRLQDRTALLHNLDNIRKEVDFGEALAGLDGFTTRAIDMVASKAARDAFDIEKEAESVRRRYGDENKDFLRARRLVESGVSVVTLSTGGWDTHGDNFNQLRSNCRASIRACMPWSPICTSAGSTRTWRWSCGASSAARRGSTAARAATTGALPVLPCWPAAACGTARSSAKPTATANGPRAAPPRRATSSRRSITTWASTRRWQSTTTTAAQRTCWTKLLRWRSWCSPSGWCNARWVV